MGAASKMSKRRGNTNTGDAVSCLSIRRGIARWCVDLRVLCSLEGPIEVGRGRGRRRGCGVLVVQPAKDSDFLEI